MHNGSAQQIMRIYEQAFIHVAKEYTGENKTPKY